MMRKYHMRREEKEIARQEDLSTILANGRFTTIAMCRNNEPYLVTLSYGFDDAENALYLHCAPEGQKIDFIKSNPDVCGTVIEDKGYRMGECGQGYRSVVYRGTVSIIDDAEGKSRGLAVLLNHLEEDPSPMREKYVSDEQALRKVCVLRLAISELTGKEGY